MSVHMCIDVDLWGYLHLYVYLYGCVYKHVNTHDFTASQTDSPPKAETENSFQAWKWRKKTGSYFDASMDECFDDVVWGFLLCWSSCDQPPLVSGFFNFACVWEKIPKAMFDSIVKKNTANAAIRKYPAKSHSNWRLLKENHVDICMLYQYSCTRRWRKFQKWKNIWIKRTCAYRIVCDNLDWLNLCSDDSNKVGVCWGDVFWWSNVVGSEVTCG